MTHRKLQKPKNDDNSLTLLQHIAEMPTDKRFRLLLRQVVRLSVTLRYRDHISWNSSKIISRLVRTADPNITDLFQG